jgi:hypothetical protein
MLWQQVAQHVLSFLVGVGVGLALASRYRIVRINGKEGTDAS